MRLRRMPCYRTLPAPDEGLAEAIVAVLPAPHATANCSGGTRGGQYLGVSSTAATVVAQAELLTTANELYRRMDAGGDGWAMPDGAYWAALPAHIRNFVRTASLSPPLRAAGDNERGQGPGYVRDRTANGADENKAARVKHQAKPSTAWHPSKLRSYKAMRVSAAPRAVSETEH